MKDTIIDLLFPIYRNLQSINNQVKDNLGYNYIDNYYKSINQC